MKYITVEEFVSSIGKQTSIELTDGKGEPDLQLLESINEVAVAEVESHLRGIYELPLADPAPQLIKGIVSDIMIYALNKRRNPKNMTDSLIAMYKLTLAKLKDLQQRKVIIDAKGAGGEASPMTGQIASWTPKQTFGTGFTKQFEE